MPVSSLDLKLRHRGDTRRLGRALGRLVAAGDLLVLDGELGAGKTFLTRAVARGLGVPAAVRVTSPTFALVHELPGRLPLLHVDLYRLDDPGELSELGLSERIGGDAVTLVEWGLPFVQELDPDYLHVRLTLAQAPSGRRCELVAHGSASAALCERLAANLPSGIERR